MRKMLDEKLARFELLEKQLSDPAVLSDSQKMAAIAREHGGLARLAAKYRRFLGVSDEIDSARQMAEDDDAEIAELAEAELTELKKRREKLWQDLLDLTIGGEDANRTRCVMEIRSGTGGDEAALFAGNLFQMYKKHAEAKGWKVEIFEHQSHRAGWLQGDYLGLRGRRGLSRTAVRERRPSRPTGT